MVEVIVIGTSGDSDTSSPDPAPSVEPLGRVERTTAIAVGVAAGGAGGYAVFASTNQAGTAILLILSAIFLLIGIQGTSLIRFSTGSNAVELERRKLRVEQAVEEAVKEDIERAEGIIEGAALAMPNLSPYASARATLYVRRVELAILELGYVATMSPHYSFGSDIVVRDTSNNILEVEVKYCAISPLSPRVVREQVSRAPSSSIPLLIVTNAGFSTVASAYVREAPREARLITWRDDGDTDILKDALAELFASVRTA